MPKIILPNGATRNVDVLNPTDELASGAPSVLDAGGVDLGEQGGQITTSQVVNPGQDENAPSTAVPLFRRTTTPRISVGVPRLRNTTRY